MADWFASNAYLGGIGWFVCKFLLFLLILSYLKNNYFFEMKDQFVGGETNGKYGLFFWPGYYTEQFVEMLMSLGGVSIWVCVDELCL